MRNRLRILIFVEALVFLIFVAFACFRFFWPWPKNEISRISPGVVANVVPEPSAPLPQENQNQSVPDYKINDAVLDLSIGVLATSKDALKPPPPPVSMDRVKTQGCVADGLLTEYNPENFRFIDLINRSNCYYLHRAIETWLKPPNFDKIRKVIDQITKKEVVYGMFLAEAIDTKANYYNYEKQRDFDFSEMCRKNTDNVWGEHTCEPAFSSEEYRDYLKQITSEAIDLGVQSFTFGQIYLQEGANTDYAPQIVKSIRSYAKQKGVDVIIGAQTGAITDAKYLALFDYIEGGVGIDGIGNVESGACLSRKESCWALLWNKAYSAKAKNVFLHLDWTGVVYDDLDVFARMNPQRRALTLQNLYTFFVGQKMGFLMPFFGVLDKNNGGCYGPKKKFYSPDDAYSCRDEGVINKILGKGKEK